jgi:hypothetical protein
MPDHSVMERLATKLAAADLDDEEAALLLSLLQGGADVEGFARRSPERVIEYQDGNDLFLKGPRTQQRWIQVLSTDRG